MLGKILVILASKSEATTIPMPIVRLLYGTCWMSMMVCCVHCTVLKILKILKMPIIDIYKYLQDDYTFTSC